MKCFITDNYEINVSPFKGPFKGKGANRKALQNLKADLDQIKSDMKLIVDEFNQAMPPPRKVLFRILMVRGIPQLWWREANERGTYLKLFESETGEKFRVSFFPATLELMENFDRKRLHYNLKATLVGHAIEHYRKYINGNLLLDGIEQNIPIVA
jgi:hypothetical protein